MTASPRFSFPRTRIHARPRARLSRTAAALAALLAGAAVLAPAGPASAQAPTGTVARPLVPRPQPPAAPTQPAEDPAADLAATDGEGRSEGGAEGEGGFVRPDYEPPSRELPQATVEEAWARLQALNKITARVEDLGIPVGETADFGTLSITVRACRRTPPEQTPENAAFLQIDDAPPGEPTARVFSGWMFASSPSVAAMEHPVYDVRVVECSDGPPPEPEDFGRDKQYALPGTPPPPAPLRPPR